MNFENAPIKILDVMLYCRKKSRYYTFPREFSALSYRLVSDGAYLFDGKRLSAVSGNISYVPSGIGYDRETEDEQVIVVHFDAVGAAPDEIKVFDFPDKNKYKTLFEQILAEWTAKKSGYKYRASSIFYQILADMDEDGAFINENSGGFIVKNRKFIEDHFSDSELAVEKLAADSFVSGTYFRKKFAETYGITPKKYMESVRIENAKMLLSSGYFSQDEIAERCGYSDVKYFRSAFKRATGIAPGAYAKGGL